MRYGLTVVEASPPITSFEPVDLADVRQYTRIDHDADDYTIDLLIPVARRYCEQILNAALIRQAWELTLDSFPQGRILEIPLRPLVSVTGITYVDINGIEQTVDPSAYRVDTLSFRPRIECESWPATQDRINAVTVTFTAGYLDVPLNIRQAILLLVGHWYEHREGATMGEVSREIEFAVTALLNTERSIPI